MANDTPQDFDSDAFDMKEAIESHNSATRTILKEAGISEAEIGTYKAMQRLAEWGAIKDGTEFRQKQKPELAELRGYVLVAFCNALEIACWTRTAKPLKTEDFVRCQCQLEAHFARYEALSALQSRWQQWPVKVDVKFLWKTSDSALGVAAQFAESIRGGMITARVLTAPYYGGWQGKIEGLRVTPVVDPYFTTWRDAALKELNTKQPLPDFPSWKIQRDAKALGMKIREEWREVAAATEQVKNTRSEAAKGTATRASASISEPLQNPLLSRGTLAVWDVVSQATKRMTYDDIQAKGVNRSTISKALKDLEKMGRISRCRGGGVLPVGLK